MKIIIVKNYEEASDKAFEIMKDVIVHKPNAILGLATGSTPIGLYQRLIQDHQENKTTYKDIQTYNLDEYYGLEPTHPQSYYYFMYHHLFKGLDIDLNNVHVPQGNSGVEEACQAYNALLSKVDIDIQLLGLGTNGHIGFNEPGTPFDSQTHYIKLAEGTRKDNARLFFNNVLEDVPTHAITMGIQNIYNAKRILLVTCGKNKAPAIKALVEGEVSVDLPVSALKDHPDFTCIIDEEAASLLTK